MHFILSLIRCYTFKKTLYKLPTWSYLRGIYFVDLTTWFIYGSICFIIVMDWSLLIYATLSWYPNIQYPNIQGKCGDHLSWLCLHDSNDGIEWDVPRAEFGKEIQWKCLMQRKSRQKRLTEWWFQIFFIFNPTWGNDPIWLIFFNWVETTN